MRRQLKKVSEPFRIPCRRSGKTFDVPCVSFFMKTQSCFSVVRYSIEIVFGCLQSVASVCGNLHVFFLLGRDARRFLVAKQFPLENAKWEFFALLPSLKSTHLQVCIHNFKMHIYVVVAAQKNCTDKLFSFSADVCISPLILLHKKYCDLFFLEKAMHTLLVGANLLFKFKK